MSGPTDPSDAEPSSRREPSGIEEDDDAEVLALLDAWEPPAYLAERPIPSRLVTWGRSSLLGAVLTGSALGLQEVLEPKRDEQIVIEVDADGEPHDLPVRLFLDPDDPSGSLCVVRRDPPPPVV